MSDRADGLVFATRTRWDRLVALVVWVGALVLGLVAVLQPSPALAAAQVTVSTCAVGMVIVTWCRP